MSYDSDPSIPFHLPLEQSPAQECLGKKTFGAAQGLLRDITETPQSEVLLLGETETLLEELGIEEEDRLNEEVGRTRILNWQHPADTSPTQIRAVLLNDHGQSLFLSVLGGQGAKKPAGYLDFAKEGTTEWFNGRLVVYDSTYIGFNVAGKRGGDDKRAEMYRAATLVGLSDLWMMAERDFPRSPIWHATGLMNKSQAPEFIRGLRTLLTAAT